MSATAAIGATVSSRLKEAASHTAIYGLGSVLQTLLGFVLIPLYTRYYSAELYGVLTLVTLTGTAMLASGMSSGKKLLVR